MDQDKCIIPVFDFLTPEQVNKINNNSWIINHRKGEILFSQDKPVSHLMFMTQGLVKVFHNNSNNKSVILKIAGPDNFVGLISSFYGSLYPFSASVIEDSQIVHANLSVINEVLSQNGEFGLKLLNKSSKETVSLVNKLLFYPQKQIPGRMADVMLFFANEIYRSYDFELPLTRQELAELIFTTKETVSRTLTEFRNDRMIEFDGRHISLISIELLKVLSRIG